MISITMPSHRLSYYTAHTGAKKIVLIASFIFSFFTASAVVTTHDMEGSYEGYSIEKIPGVDEFVAAGTFFVDGLLKPYTGYHFVHLDINGNVLDSRYVVPDPLGAPSASWEARVVDIVVEDASTFWIIMSARDNANMVDFALAEKVILGPGIPPLPNQLRFNNSDPAYSNLYPTHGVFVMGHLFICGYVSNQPVSGSSPTVTSLNKQGMMSSTDVSQPIPNPTTNLALWDTYPGPGSNFDFDMALKIVSEGDYLFVTGAGNSDNTAFQPSGAIFIPFTYPNLTLPSPASNATVSWMVAPQPQLAHGIVGIDVMRKNGRMLLLSNRFTGGAMETWGVASLDQVTGLTTPGLPCFAYRSSASRSDWIKQFLPHPVDPYNSNVSLVGEVVKEYPNCTAPTAYPAPSFANVNPFVVDCDILWDPATGINMPVFNQIIHASNDDSSTKASTLDYLLNAWLTPAEATLENKTRLTTFAVRYADGRPDEIAMMYPKRSALDNRFLNTKFLRTDGVGHEPVCQNEWTCQPVMSTMQMNSSVFPLSYQPANNPNIGPFKHRLMPMIEDDCQNGAYKTTGIHKATLGKDWAMYPNPAFTEVNIVPAAGSQSYSFTLTDVTGKEVLGSAGAASGRAITISLQGLSAGVYIATYSDGNTVSTKKLVINK